MSLSLALSGVQAVPLTAEAADRAPASNGEVLRIPDAFGSVQQYLPGKSPRTVVLIQDAHSVPEAQKNIANLIRHLNENHGIGLIAAEGASKQFDAALFQAFPDGEIFEKTLSEYMERGELTGPAAAALSQKGPRRAVFQGVEDWALYEKGYGLYLEASSKEENLLREIFSRRDALKKHKEKVYSRALLELDRRLESFHSNGESLPGILRDLAAIKPPAPDSGLHTLLEVIAKEESPEAVSGAGIEEAYAQLKRHLEEEMLPLEEVMALNRKHQDFRTGALPAAGFAAYLSEAAARHEFPLKWNGRQQNEINFFQKLRDIEGTKIFHEFESYAEELKETLFRSDEERSLDLETKKLRLLERLVRLELREEDWRAIKEMGTGMISFPGAEVHLKFYENAEARDGAMFERLIQAMDGHKSETAVLAAGGFHAEGLMRRMRENDISCLLVRPRIGRLPEVSPYRAQMKGDVSWGRYLSLKNGEIDLYGGFTRGLRDALLERSRTENDRPYLLKEWRDGLLRGLAENNSIQRAGEYTKYLDEAAASPEEAGLFSWEAKAEELIRKLSLLGQRGEFTEQNLIHLLNPAAFGVPALNGQLSRGERLRLTPEAVRFFSGPSFKDFGRPAKISDSPIETVREVLSAEEGPDFQNTGLRAEDLSGTALAEALGFLVPPMREQILRTSWIDLFTMVRRLFEAAFIVWNIEALAAIDNRPAPRLFGNVIRFVENAQKRAAVDNLRRLSNDRDAALRRAARSALQRLSRHFVAPDGKIETLLASEAFRSELRTGFQNIVEIDFYEEKDYFIFEMGDFVFRIRAGDVSGLLDKGARDIGIERRKMPGEWLSIARTDLSREFILDVFEFAAAIHREQSAQSANPFPSEVVFGMFPSRAGFFVTDFAGNPVVFDTAESMIAYQPGSGTTPLFGSYEDISEERKKVIKILAAIALFAGPGFSEDDRSKILEDYYRKDLRAFASAVVTKYEPEIYKDRDLTMALSVRLALDHVEHLIEFFAKKDPSGIIDPEDGNLRVMDNSFLFLGAKGFLLPELRSTLPAEFIPAYPRLLTAMSEAFTVLKPLTGRAITYFLRDFHEVLNAASAAYLKLPELDSNYGRVRYDPARGIVILTAKEERIFSFNQTLEHVLPLLGIKVKELSGGSEISLERYGRLVIIPADDAAAIPGAIDRLFLRAELRSDSGESDPSERIETGRLNPGTTSPEGFLGAGDTGLRPELRTSSNELAPESALNVDRSELRTGSREPVQESALNVDRSELRQKTVISRPLSLLSEVKHWASKHGINPDHAVLKIILTLMRSGAELPQPVSLDFERDNETLIGVLESRGLSQKVQKYADDLIRDGEWRVEFKAADAADSGGPGYLLLLDLNGKREKLQGFKTNGRLEPVNFGTKEAPFYSVDLEKHRGVYSYDIYKSRFSSLLLAAASEASVFGHDLAAGKPVNWRDAAEFREGDVVYEPKGSAPGLLQTKRTADSLAPFHIITSWFGAPLIALPGAEGLELYRFDGDRIYYVRNKRVELKKAVDSYGVISEVKEVEIPGAQGSFKYIQFSARRPSGAPLFSDNTAAGDFVTRVLRIAAEEIARMKALGEAPLFAMGYSPEIARKNYTPSILEYAEQARGMFLAYGSRLNYIGGRAQSLEDMAQAVERGEYQAAVLIDEDTFIKNGFPVLSLFGTDFERMLRKKPRTEAERAALAGFMTKLAENISARLNEDKEDLIEGSSYYLALTETDPEEDFASGTSLEDDPLRSDRKSNTSGTPLGIDSPRSELRPMADSGVINTGKYRIAAELDGPRLALTIYFQDNPDFIMTREYFAPAEIRIGRVPESDLRLDDISVSRNHARIRFNKRLSRWEVKDLGSTNGVYVNGYRIDSGEDERFWVPIGNLDWAVDRMKDFPEADLRRTLAAGLALPANAPAGSYTAGELSEFESARRGFLGSLGVPFLFLVRRALMLKVMRLTDARWLWAIQGGIGDRYYNLESRTLREVEETAEGLFFFKVTQANGRVSSERAPAEKISEWPGLYGTIRLLERPIQKRDAEAQWSNPDPEARVRALFEIFLEHPIDLLTLYTALDAVYKRQNLSIDPAGEAAVENLLRLFRLNDSPEHIAKLMGLIRGSRHYREIYEMYQAAKTRKETAEASRRRTAHEDRAKAMLENPYVKALKDFTGSGKPLAEASEVVLREAAPALKSYFDYFSSLAREDVYDPEGYYAGLEREARTLYGAVQAELNFRKARKTLGPNAEALEAALIRLTSLHGRRKVFYALSFIKDEEGSMVVLRDDGAAADEPYFAEIRHIVRELREIIPASAGSAQFDALFTLLPADANGSLAGAGVQNRSELRTGSGEPVQKSALNDDRSELRTTSPERFLRDGDTEPGAPGSRMNLRPGLLETGMGLRSELRTGSGEPVQESALNADRSELRTTSPERFLRDGDIGLRSELRTAAGYMLSGTLGVPLSRDEAAYAARVSVSAGPEETIKQLELLKARLRENLPELVENQIGILMKALSALPKEGYAVAYDMREEDLSGMKDFTGAVRSFGTIRQVFVASETRIPGTFSAPLREAGILISRGRLERPGIVFQSSQRWAGFISTGGEIRDFGADSRFMPVVSLDRKAVQDTHISRLVITLQTAVALLIAHEAGTGREEILLKPAALLKKYELFPGSESAVISREGNSLVISAAAVRAYLMMEAARAFARAA